jgi:hypothetical protein
VTVPIATPVLFTAEKKVIWYSTTAMELSQRSLPEIFATDFATDL